MTDPEVQLCPECKKIMKIVNVISRPGIYIYYGGGFFFCGCVAREGTNQ